MIYAQNFLQHNDTFRNALLYGASAERIAATLADNGFTNFIINTSDTIEPIVAQAQSLAKTGDAVVLSPGFPSFDMFKNFEERGRLYNQAIEALLSAKL